MRLSKSIQDLYNEIVSIFNVTIAFKLVFKQYNSNNSLNQQPFRITAKIKGCSILATKLIS